MAIDSTILYVIGGLLTAATLAQVVLSLLDRTRKPENQAIASLKETSETLRYDLGQLAGGMRDGFRELSKGQQDQQTHLAQETKEIHKALGEQNAMIAKQQATVDFLKGYIESEKAAVRRVEDEVRSSIAGIEERVEQRLSEIDATVLEIKKKVCQ